MSKSMRSLKDRLAELARRRQELLSKTPEAELAALAEEEARLRAEMEAAEKEAARLRQEEIKKEVHRLLVEVATHAHTLVEPCEALLALSAESLQLALEKSVGPQTNVPAASRALARYARAWLEEVARFAPDIGARFRPPPRPEVEIKIHSADELMR